MKKVLFTAAAALTAIAAATPAAAQGYYGYPQPAPYGNAYGYHNNYGQVRAMQARVDNLQREISRLDRRNILSNREARSLQNQARNIEVRLQRLGYNGLNWNEMRDIEMRLRNLEIRIQREARDGNRYRDRNGWVDRDRNGHDDRLERQQGYRYN